MMPPSTLHDRRWAILALLSPSVTPVTVGNTIIKVAAPTLSRDLGASMTELQ